MSTHRATFLARVPDDAGHVDLRGLLRSGRCSLFGDPDGGFVVTSWDFPYAVAHGLPEAGTVRQAVDSAAEHAGRWDGGDDEAPGWHLMVAPAAAEAVAAALPGWVVRSVVLHARPAGAAPVAPAAPAGCDLRLAPEGWRAAGLHLGHLPPGLRREMEADHVAELPLAAAVVDGRVAAFCYAPVETETLWDVSVDTLAAFRRRGLAAACFELLARHQATRGKRPVWGAYADNAASLGLAARLGFGEHVRLVSFDRP